MAAMGAMARAPARAAAAAAWPKSAPSVFFCDMARRCADPVKRWRRGAVTRWKAMASGQASMARATIASFIGPWVFRGWCKA